MNKYFLTVMSKRGSCNGKTPKVLGDFEEPRMFLFNIEQDWWWDMYVISYCPHFCITLRCHLVAISDIVLYSKFIFMVWRYIYLLIYALLTYLFNWGHSSNIFDTISADGSWSVKLQLSVLTLTSRRAAVESQLLQLHI